MSSKDEMNTIAEENDVSVDGERAMTSEVSIAGGSRITWVAKWGKERYSLDELDGSNTTIGDLKGWLEAKTNILVKRQKLIGLIESNSKNSKLSDDLLLSQVICKRKDQTFLLMGTPEAKIFVDHRSKEDGEEDFDVIDDFDLEFTAGSEPWLQHVANQENLKKFTQKTQIHVMNDPRDNKPLMVLDLDHTLLDFSSKSLLQQQDSPQQSATQNPRLSHRQIANAMKRPHMDEFLTAVYPYYDLVVWSQTSWRWLETKLTELGMLTNPGYNFCFVLDKTSMFRITSTTTKGTSSKKVEHQVKPLQLIWNKFPNRWNATNTVHLDDLRRNFALNWSSGLRVLAYYRKKKKRGTIPQRDTELAGLTHYLVQLAQATTTIMATNEQPEPVDFASVNFDRWQDVVAGKVKLEDTVDPAIVAANKSKFNQDKDKDKKQTSK